MLPIADSVLERWFTPGFRARSPQTVQSARQMLLNVSVDGYIACCAAIRDMDQRETVAQIKAPTLVIYGASDPVTPASEAHFLAEQIRGAVEVELAAAHLSNVEQADAFTKAVSQFLSQ